MLRTIFTNPIAKSRSPGLSDTFFSHLYPVTCHLLFITWISAWKSDCRFMLVSSVKSVVSSIIVLDNFNLFGCTLLFSVLLYLLLFHILTAANCQLRQKYCEMAESEIWDILRNSDKTKFSSTEPICQFSRQSLVLANLKKVVHGIRPWLKSRYSCTVRNFPFSKLKERSGS